MWDNNIIVVEGKTDTNKIQSIYPNLTCIETNGSAIDEHILQHIKQLSLTHQIIIFTDPDYPGQKIRQIVSDYLDNKCAHAFIDKNLAIKNNKVGIAQADPETIKKALASLVHFNSNQEPSISWHDYIILVDTKPKRDYLSQNLHLAKVNNKTLYKWLNLMGINKTEVQEILKEQINDGTAK
ncbi:ribonuclease M5 [Spiroplasma sp. DGKH1]|uniref:ribonuclease M5 n=1 Tax=Spiroplasma sp. DGKH1 TaxID=3050074 RepID=UPI0034C5DA82